MRLIPFLLLASVLFAGSPVRTQEKSAVMSGFTPMSRFDPARDATGDIKDALREAQVQGKRVLIDVGGEWCIWCRRLDTLFQQNRELNDYREQNFVTVKVNWSPENKNEAILSQYPKVAGYPHLFVLDNDGKLLHSQDTGKLESGKHHDPEKVMAFLKLWAPR